MTLASSTRRFVLAAHVLTSVGWLGAVGAFLALAIAGLSSHAIEVVQAAYIAMDLTYRFVIVPLGLASVATGLVSSLGTDWGLIRHYWVLFKLLLVVPATGLMLVHIQPVSYLAGVAAAGTISRVDLASLRFQVTTEASAALLVLLVATTLSVYKPRGKTGYGLQRQYG